MENLEKRLEDWLNDYGHQLKHTAFCELEKIINSPTKLKYCDKCGYTMIHRGKPTDRCRNVNCK